MNVFLDGYFDNNLGDDLMLLGIMKQFPSVEFYSVINNSTVINTFKNIENFHILNKEQKKLMSFDFYILIGGSIFQYKNTKNTLRRYLKMLKLKRHKVLIIGSNLGPFNSLLAKTVCKKELLHAELVTVRDSYSYKLTNRMKLENVKYFDDIVFELLEEVFNFKRNGKVSDFTFSDYTNIGITAYRAVNNQSANYALYEKIAEMVNNQKITSNKIIVHLFSFDTELENDLSAAYHIKSLINNDINVEIIPYLGSNIKEFLNKFSEMHYVIPIRFHGAILSDYFNIPFYPISYSDKMINYLTDYVPQIDPSDILSLDNINFRSFKAQPLISSEFINRSVEVKTGHIKEIKKIIGV